MNRNAKSEVERVAKRLRAASMRLDALGDEESRTAVAKERELYEAALETAKASMPAEEEVSGAKGARARGRGERMGAETTGLEAHVSVRMENLPTSMAHVLARTGFPLVTVTVRNVREKKSARVAARCWIEGYSASAVMSKEIPRQASEAFDLFPPLFPDKVRTLTEMAIASLHVEVRDLDGKDEVVASYPIPLLPPTTAVLAQMDPSTGAPLDLTRLLAAWVTPNAPEVLMFLRNAADFSKLKAMLGYQTDADGIREHVRAIYDALKAAAIVYVNSTTAFGRSVGQHIQRVRLPRESLAQRSANCIDGTVLMASLLEATGLDPAIVLVPGHAYLGFRAAQGASWEYVETTMIGTETFEKACAQARETSKDAAATGTLTVLDVSVLRSQDISPME